MTTRSATTPPKAKPSSTPAWQPPLKQDGTPTLALQPKRWQPHNYQKKAIKFLLERGAAALFLDPGLGKTSITLAALKVLKRDNQMRGALVIAPLRPAKMTWPAEARKWEDFKGLSVGVLHGDRKQKVLEEDHDIYVINPEGLPWLFERTKRRADGSIGKTWREFLTPAGKLLLTKVNVLVVDELSKFKHTDTERFKRIKPWLTKFDRRYGLTGSPAPNGLEDLFGQCFMLDLGNALGQFITHYRSRYFTQLPDGYTYRLNAGAEELIHERVRPLALRMAAADHLELPKLRQLPIKLDLPADVRKLYDSLEEDLLVLLNSNELITAPNAATAKMLCRQLCSGAMYKGKVDPLTGTVRSGKREWEQIHNIKIDAMADLVEELQGQQLLVAYEFQHDLERIVKKFPNMPYFGKSEKEDARLEAAWNAGTLPMVAGHAQSIGHGLNLQASSAHNILWFTLTWDYELFDQLVRRLLRQGNDAEFVNCYSLVMRNTVEDSVAYALKQKKVTQDSLLNALVHRKRLDD